MTGFILQGSSWTLWSGVWLPIVRHLLGNGGLEAENATSSAFYDASMPSAVVT